jgi:hypothetical protein
VHPCERSTAGVPGDNSLSGGVGRMPSDPLTRSAVVRARWLRRASRAASPVTAAPPRSGPGIPMVPEWLVRLCVLAVLIYVVGRILITSFGRRIA